MKQTRTVRIALIIVLALGLASCADDSERATSRSRLIPVRYYLGGLASVPVPGSAPWFVGIEKGFFSDAGIDMEMLPGESPSAGPGLLESGRAEFASMDLLSVALFRNENPDVDIKIVAIHHARAPYAVYSLADGEDIRRPEDLEDVTIYQGTGSFTAGIAKTWAEGVGVTGIKIEEGDREALARLLLTGRIPAVASTVFSRPSYLAAAKDSGTEVSVLELAEHGLDDFYGTGMAVSPRFASENPDAVRAFVEATFRTFEWCFENAEEAAAIMEELYPTVPAPATIAALEELETVVTDDGEADRLGAIDPSKVAATVELGEKVFGFDIDPQTLVTTEFID